MTDEPNILELDPPPTTQMVERVRFFAKALAYGVVNDMWLPKFWTHIKTDPQRWSAVGRDEYINQFHKYMFEKWEGHSIHISLMESFGYIELSRETSKDTAEYILTPKAFSLLETPAAPPNVFISYRRNGSAAPALLAVYRLALAGVQAFIDIEMNVGVDWDPHLKERVWASKYFVCLIGAKTHLSLNVANEVTWAREAAETNGLEIIPLFQPDFIRNPDEVYPEWFEYLLSKNGIPVSGENPLDYKFALDRLLNRLGYAPL